MEHRRLVKPPEDTADSGPLTWSISLRRVAIAHGSFSLHDAYGLSAPDHVLEPGTLEYHSFRIDSIGLSAELNVRNDDLTLNILSLTAQCIPEKFRLASLKGAFHLDNKGGSAKNLTIETGGSSLTLDAEMKRIDIFEGVKLEAMEQNPTRVRLNARRIDLGEVKWFLAPVSFLEGSASLDLEVSGEFGNLSVSQLVLEIGKRGLTCADR